MSNTSEFHGTPPHIALLPGAGMGHLIPFLRLAAMLASRGCTVTLITIKPTVSAAESSHISAFFSTFPHIKRLDLQIHHFLPSNPTTDHDPFFIQFEAISRSVHLLHPLLLSSSPPLSAIFSDFFVTTSISQIADDLCIPNYIVGTTSARFHSLVACLPFLELSANKFSNSVEIPGHAAWPISISSIPPPLFNPNHPFTAMLASNALALPKAKGVIINTFNSFETETITALNSGGVSSNIPIPVLPVGPLEPCYLEKEDHHLPWLDKQSAESIVYVGFGNRTAMTKDQIKELGNGLQRSGYGFLWVIKSNKVDKEDNEELQDLLGKTFLERTKNKGMVIKGWVDQENILAHPAIGVFVSHCGWNSVMEAAQVGVPVLAWPQNGDQKINAEVAVKAGLGMWMRDWGWGGERLVNGEEIAEKITGMMGDEILRNKARKVGKEANKAGETGGTSEKVLMEVIERLKHKHGN